MPPKPKVRSGSSASKRPQSVASKRPQSAASRRPQRTAKKKSTEELISAAAAQIAQEALKPTVTVASLAQMAHADATFAMKLLALVNSPAFARAQPVTDISHAAALLGIRGLRTVALSLLVSTLCPPNEACRVLMANSLRRAVSCKLIAQAVQYKDLDGSFATGLFLDSGLLRHTQSHLGAVVAIATGPAHHRVLREMAEELLPHPKAGAEMATQYGLPEDTIHAIEHHHDEVPPDETLGQIAWLAERIAGVYENPHVDEARKQALSDGAQLGLKKSTIDGILDALPAAVTEIAAALKRDIGVVRDLEDLRGDASRALSDINHQYEGVIRKLGELIREKELLAEELQKANRALENMAHTDVLTGLCNRRALEEYLSRYGAQASREDTWLGVIAVDVDHFKKFNDTHGHAAGDLVLAQVGRILLEECRKGDVPARYGGEEFTVLLPNTDPDGSQLVAERLRQRLEASETVHEGKSLRMTASFGVMAARGANTNPVAALMTAADEALYVAKREGRNRVALAKSKSGPALAKAPAKVSTRKSCPPAAE